MPVDKETMDELKKYIDEFKEQLTQRDLRTSYIDARMDRAVADLQTTVRGSLDIDTVKHREYVVSLYSKFERLVYVLVLIAAASVTYFGFQVSDIPETIEQKVTQFERTVEEQIDTKFIAAIADLQRRIEENTKRLAQDLTEYNETAKDHLASIAEVRRKAGETNDHLTAVVDAARKKKVEAEAAYETVLTENKGILDGLRSDVVLLKFEKELPATRGEMRDLWDTIEIAARLEDNNKIARLVDMILFLSDDAFGREQPNMQKRFGGILAMYPQVKNEVAVLRGGLVLGNQSIVDVVRQHLKTKPTMQNARLLRLVLGVFRGPVVQRQPFSRGGRVRRRTADFTVFFDELVSLVAQVEVPAVAVGAMNILRVEALSSAERSRLNVALLNWLDTDELKGRLLDNEIKKLPLDEETSNFFVRILGSRSIEGRNKPEVANEMIAHVVKGGGQRARSFVELMGKARLVKYADEQSRLALEFGLSEKTITGVFAERGQIEGGGWHKKTLDLVVGKVRIFLSELTVTVEEDGSWRIRIGGAQMDGKALQQGQAITVQKVPRDNVVYAELTFESGTKVVVRFESRGNRGLLIRAGMVGGA